MTTNDKMLAIKALDDTAHLELSEWTGQWFVQSRLHISDGVMLSGVCEHRRTPDQAVEAFHAVLRNVGLTDFDHVIVANDHDRSRRRHYRWNGAAFSEEPIEAFTGRKVVET